MKKALILLLTVGLAFAAMACTKEVNVPVAEVFGEVKEAMKASLLATDDYTEEDLKDGLPMFMEADMLDEEPNFLVSDPDIFDKSLLAEGLVTAPMINIRSDEVIVLKAKDKKDVPALEEMLQKELENRLDLWATYLPDQHEKVKNTIIKVQGNYLLYATWSDAPALEAAFTKALSGK